MFDSYIKYEKMNIVQNQIYIDNFIWETQTQLVIIQMRNYMVGRWKIMKLKQEDVGISRPSWKNRHINVSLCPSYHWHVWPVVFQSFSVLKILVPDTLSVFYPFPTCFCIYLIHYIPLVHFVVIFSFLCDPLESTFIVDTPCVFPTPWWVP